MSRLLEYCRREVNRDSHCTPHRRISVERPTAPRIVHTPLRLLLFTLMALGLPLVAGLRAGAAPDVVPGLNGNEPHAAVANPRNPQNVIVSDVNQLRISTNFGATFPISVSATLTTAPTGASNRACGDDVLAFDAAGRLFWAYLVCTNDNASPPNRIDISIFVQQVNPTTGALIGTATDLTPGTNAVPNLHSDDKPWLAADANPASPYANNLYLVWTRLDTNNGQVMFARSINQGTTWSNPQQISAAGEGFVWPSHIAVAPNGDIYAGYHGDTCNAATASMFIVRDSSGGAGLSATPVVILQKTFFQSAVTCNVQSNPLAGTEVPNTHFWMQGAMQPYTLPDPTRPGNIYVVANDDPNDNFTTGDPGDVILARSTDYGNTWTISTISHAPAGTLQVFPQAAIDQDGRVVVSWYDTRRQLVNNGPDGTAGTTDDYFNLDTYATVSRDGGLTFTNDFRVNNAPFDPDLGAPCRFGPSGCGGTGTARTLRIGEYNGLAATDGVAYVAFSGNTATGQQILFDIFSIRGAFPDAFEPNDALQPGVATDLGSPDTLVVQGLTIHSDTDEDFFKVTTLRTGKLDLQIAMNGRIVDLDLQVRDRFNNVIATSTAGTDTSAVERITIPAVEGQPYFLRVFAEPGQIPPLNVYDLSVVNKPAPTPFALALAPGSDSGRSGADNVTNVATPTVLLRVDTQALQGLVLSPTGSNTPGYRVQVFDNGNYVGDAAAVAGQPGAFSLAFPTGAPLAEGTNALTARVLIVDATTDPALGRATGAGDESAALQVILDTAKPTVAPAPDLTASSDSGGVNDDNITTISTPKFAGLGEANATVRLYANGALVGQGTVTPAGAYEITVQPLADGVYSITTWLEDLAGNVSDPSPALTVTIANQSLTLPGLTVGAPVGPVTIDLDAGTIAGYPGVAGATGKIGIVGIPAVALGVNGQALTIRGTPGDDALTHTPTGAQAGRVTRRDAAQTIDFVGVGGAFTIDPLAGNNDVVTVMGSAGADTVTVNVDTTDTVQINGLLMVWIPNADVDRLAIMTLDGQDIITVNVKDTVSAKLSIDASNPAPAPNKAGDTLLMNAVSPKGFIQNSPGGPTQGSGVATVTYPKTTNTTATVEYTAVEKFSK